MVSGILCRIKRAYVRLLLYFFFFFAFCALVVNRIVALNVIVTVSRVLFVILIGSGSDKFFIAAVAAAAAGELVRHVERRNSYYSEIIEFVDYLERPRVTAGWINCWIRHFCSLHVVRVLFFPQKEVLY